MSTPIRIRRSAVPGKVPTVEQVQLGELAVNTYDGKAFLKKDVSGVESIVNIGGGYPGKTYFVTDEGLDTNDGESISSAFATLKHALSLTVVGDTVELSSGTFTEIFPLTVPPGVIVRGKGIRSTIIQPTSETERNDAFLLNGETTIEELTITNLYYNSSDDTGYGFRFAPNMVTTTRSPYVQRITVLTRGSDTSASDPYGFDTADNYPTSKVAGRGAFIDGSVVASNTLEPAMLFNEVTFITPNQIGLKMTNGARAEWVNCFTYFSSISVDGTSGSVGVASTANATLKLSGITTTVTANQVIKYYQSGSPVAIGTVVSTDGDYIVINGKGSGTFNSVGLGSAQDVRIFESDGTTQVGTASTILWADYQKFGADLRSIGSASNFGTVGVRGDGVGVQLRLFGYNFGCVGAGKTFTQDPTLTVRANEAVQLNGGRVYFQSVDQEGNFRVGNIFEISQETGAVSLASTSDINIAGTATIQNLNVTGVSTFANPLELNSNLYVTGISTFTNNVAITGFTTFSSDSMLGSNLNVAGITTTATFRVTGISTLMGDVELESNLRVAGVSTFSSPAMVNSDLNVTGIATVGNFRVTGLSTITGDANFTNNVNIGGITTTSTFRVTGISTLTGDVELENNLQVAGVSTFASPAMINSDLNVTGIATVGNFRVTGISTLTGDVELSNNLRVAGVSTFSSPAMINSDLNVTGISTLVGDVELQNNIRVSGVSTFSSPAMINSDLNVTGISTLVGDVELDNNLQVTGVSTFSSSAMINSDLNVTGISTLIGDVELNNNLRVSGVSTITGDTNFTNNVNVGGITTTSTFRVTGISTLTGDVELEGNLDVAGVSTFSSSAMINSDLNVTGISTLVGDVELNNNLRVTGVSTLTGDVQLANNLQVAGVTTFVGVTTYQNDLYVGNDLFVLGDTRIVGVLTVGSSSIVIDGTNNQINVGTGVTAHTDQVSVTQFTASGVSTFAQNVDIRTDLNVNGVTTSTALKISGVSTFSGDVELDTNLRVAGVSTFNSPAMVNSNLNVTGVTTTKDLNVIGVTTIGSSAILNDNLQVAGITTLSSALYGTSATLSDNVTINSNLTVAGNVTIGGTTLALTAQELKIKDKSIILGITTNAVDADVSTDTSANHGGIAIASTEGSPLVPLFVTGINTSPNTYKQLAWVKADTMGAGTTDAWLSNYAVGIGSTLVPNSVRLAVGGIQLTDTNVTATKFIGRDGTISYLDGNNLYYTGIGSINNLYVNVGVITHATATDLSVTGVSTLANVQIGYGATDLIVTGDARVTGILTVGTASITINGTTEEIGVGETTRIHTLGFDVGNSFMHSTGIDVDDIHSSGISSLTTLYVSGISTFDGSITANSIQITGVGINTFENVNATNLTTKYFLLDDVGLTIVSESATIGIGTDTIGITTTNVAIGDTVISDTAMTTPFAVTGFTADGLSVIIDGLTENETEVTETVTISRNTGIGTFGTIRGSIGTIDTLYSVTGVITTLNGTTATYTNLNGTDGTISNLTSSEIRGTNLNYSGLGTITTFESTLATIGISTLTTSTITTLTSDDVTVNNTGYVENLTYNIGIATQITVENTNITGILTANNLNITGQTYFTEIAAGIASANTGIITNFTSTNLYSDYITVTDVNTGITTADVEIGIGTDILPINVIGLEVGDFVIAPSIPGGTTILNTPYLTIVSAASTLGATTSIVGIATTGVIAGDYIESTSISQGTTVSTILTDAVEISSPSTNVTEISQVVEIYRLTGLGITISNASTNSAGISTELVSIERGSGVGVGRFSTLYVNSGIITSLSTNEIDLTGSLSVTDVTVSSAATITRANITDLIVGVTTGNIGVFTSFDTGNIYASGVGTVSNLYVNIGFTTFFNITEEIVGVSTITRFVADDIIVSGVTTTTDLYVNTGVVTDISGTNSYYIGVSTANTLYSNVGFVTTLSGDNFNYTGISSAATLNINVGLVTHVSGTDLYYSGISTADTLYTNTGFVTTLSGTRATYTDADITYGYISGVGTAVNLISTVGFVTFVTGENLNYTGVGTIQNLEGLGIGYTNATLQFVNSIEHTVTGVSTIESLFVNVGIATTLSGDRLTYNIADLTDTYTSGVSSISTLKAAVGLVTYASGTNLDYAGVGTINFLEGNNLSYTGIVTLGIVTATALTTQDFNLGGGALNFTGIATITNIDSVNITATYITGENLNYSGIGTINVLNLYEVQTEAFTTTSSLHVGVGGSLFSVVSGIGSVGIGTTNAREKLHVYGNIMYGDDLNTGTTRVAISSDAATTIHESLSRLEYRSVEYQIQATTSGVGSDGRYQFTRLLAIHDGTVAYNVEYANVGTGTDVASYIVDIDEGLDAGYIRLQATPAQTGITTFVVNFVGYRI